MRPIILPEAEEELAAAAEWYEAKRPGLGVDFVIEVEQAFAEIADYPLGSPLWRLDRPYRQKVLDRFPYVLFYTVAGLGRVEVAAIAHAKRRPGYWLERTS